MKARVFVKLGGSFISPKRSKREKLLSSRVTQAAREIKRALDLARKNGDEISLVLGHGAGMFGHGPAKKYAAKHGITDRFGWRPLFEIRESMSRMNLRIIQDCARGKLFPLTVSPFSIAEGRGGKLRILHLATIQSLLDNGQIPLIHGDIILDSQQGFTIASTESLLVKLSTKLPFDRIVAVTDVDGVYDKDGKTIPLITAKNKNQHLRAVRGSKGTDVTGGMKDKVENLLKLTASRRIGEARIISCVKRPRDLCEAILGTGNAGTLIRGRA